MKVLTDYFLSPSQPKLDGASQVKKRDILDYFSSPTSTPSLKNCNSAPRLLNKSKSTDKLFSAAQIPKSEDVNCKAKRGKKQDRCCTDSSDEVNSENVDANKNSNLKRMKKKKRPGVDDEGQERYVDALNCVTSVHPKKDKLCKDKSKTKLKLKSTHKSECEDKCEVTKYSSEEKHTSSLELLEEEILKPTEEESEPKNDCSTNMKTCKDLEASISEGIEKNKNISALQPICDDNEKDKNAFQLLMSKKRVSPSKQKDDQNSETQVVSKEGGKVEKCSELVEAKCKTSKKSKRRLKRHIGDIEEEDDFEAKPNKTKLTKRQESIDKVLASEEGYNICKSNRKINKKRERSDSEEVDIEVNTKDLENKGVVNQRQKKLKKGNREDTSKDIKKKSEESTNASKIAIQMEETQDNVNIEAFQNDQIKTNGKLTDVKAKLSCASDTSDNEKTPVLKSRGSLFSYFSKVTKEESMKSQEKVTLQVRALVHTPPLKSDVNSRPKEIKNIKQTKQARKSVELEEADRITLLGSEEVKDSEQSEGLSMSVRVQEKSVVKVASKKPWKLRVRLKPVYVDEGSCASSIIDFSTDSLLPDTTSIVSCASSIKDEETEPLSFTVLPQKFQKSALQVHPVKKLSKQQMNERQITIDCANKALRKAKGLKKKRIFKASVPQAKEKITDSPTSDETSPFLRRSSRVSSLAARKMITMSVEKESRKSPSKALQKSGVKLAPVFLCGKKKARPKVDAAILKARREFLMSGVPDNVRKLADTQKSLQILEAPLFPSISHVQQRAECEGVWSLMWPEIPMLMHGDAEDTGERYLTRHKEWYSLTSECEEHTSTCTYARPKRLALDVFKKALKLLKDENSEVSVHRKTKQLLEKRKKFEQQQLMEEKIEVKDRRKGVAEDDDVSIIDESSDKEKRVSFSDVPWTEKYQPSSSCDIIGNQSAVTKLKTWLTEWSVWCKQKGWSGFQKDYSDDTESSDEDESFTNAAILIGPPGCGKTATVYALAKELGYKVLEVNASSRRSGRSLLTQLQEATLSHRVSISGQDSSQSIFNMEPKKAKRAKRMAKEARKKKRKQDSTGGDTDSLSLILFEDVDVVFDEDEGFLAAVNNLMTTSRRPMILTSNGFIPKLKGRHMTLYFEYPLISVSAPILQMICLIEGIQLSSKAVSDILVCVDGDLRKAMLQLQYWVLSGGNATSHASNVKKSCSYNAVSKPEPLEGADDDNNDSTICDNDLRSLLTSTEQFSQSETEASGELMWHAGCAESMLGLPPWIVALGVAEKNQVLSRHLSPAFLWNNIRAVLPLPTLAVQKRETKPAIGKAGCYTARHKYDPSIFTADSEEDDEVPEKPIVSNQTVPETKPKEVPQKLSSYIHKAVKAISRIVDNISHFESLCNFVPDSSMPLSKLSQYESVLVDREDTFENLSWFAEDLQLNIKKALMERSYSHCYRELNTLLVFLKEVNDTEVKCEEFSEQLSLEGMPEELHLRWSTSAYDLHSRVNATESAEAVISCLPLPVQRSKQSLALDYLPVLRSICRSEEVRHSTSTTRRSGRYSNYLRTAGFQVPHPQDLILSFR